MEGLSFQKSFESFMVEKWMSCKLHGISEEFWFLARTRYIFKVMSSVPSSLWPPYPINKAYQGASIYIILYRVYCIHSKISAYAYIQRNQLYMRLFSTYAFLHRRLFLDVIWLQGPCALIFKVRLLLGCADLWVYTVSHKGIKLKHKMGRNVSFQAVFMAKGSCILKL